MNGATVTVNVPASAWERLVKAAGSQHRTAEELLVRLIHDYTGDEVDSSTEGFYAELTRRYLQGALQRVSSVNMLRLSEATSAAIEASFGTADPVDLIERARTRP